MKYISFNKYKQYLSSIGFIQEKGENVYPNLSFKTIFFSNPNKNYKYVINIFINSDIIMSINKGYGSLYLGYKSVKIDKRKNFWKDLSSEY